MGASNVSALGASLGTLLLTVRLLGHAEFSDYATALAVQALCYVVAVAVSPQCARNLASDHPSPFACGMIRLRSGLLGALVMVLIGGVLQRISYSQLPAMAWILLALQIPFSALEAHQLQCLQMANRFGAHSLAQPLSRVLRLIGTAAAFWIHLTGSVWITGIQAGSQALAAVVLWRWFAAKQADHGAFRFSLPDAGWNSLSGSVVWASTRANILVSRTRMDAHQTAFYGLADTLASSLMVVLQSIMTLVQPGIYRWRGSDGIRPILGRALVVGAAGTAACIAAASFAPVALEYLLDRSWTGTATVFQMLCIGGIFQSWAAVSGAILHRHQATKTILALESAAATGMLISTILLPAGSTAVQSAACWSLGRAIWAVGGCLTATRHVHASLRSGKMN
ncbi:MAG: hypothetical protein RL173_2510 [Fibrobacterota bacterium]